MTDLRTAAQQALEALEKYRQMMFAEAGCRWDAGDAAITALRAALAQQAEPVQEPVAWLDEEINCAYTPEELDGGTADGLVPLYTAPPQRKPLTEKEMYAVDEEARKNFRQSQIGVRGQQITYWDELTPWLISAVERAHGIVTCGDTKE